jgi:PPOX class probable F420-dependent enzyme
VSETHGESAAFGSSATGDGDNFLHGNLMIPSLEEETYVSAIPENYLDLTQKKAFAQLATLMPDGSPHVAPVWFEYDGKDILVNSAKGRVKDKNMRRDPRVGLDILDPDNPYRHLSIRGRVVEITEKGAEEHIDKLAKKYIGQDRYPYRGPGEVRVLYKIEPEHTYSMG